MQVVMSLIDGGLGALYRVCGSDACAAPRYCVSISSLDLRAYVGDAGNGATCRPISGDLCYSISMVGNHTLVQP